MACPRAGPHRARDPRRSGRRLGRRGRRERRLRRGLRLEPRPLRAVPGAPRDVARPLRAARRRAGDRVGRRGRRARARARREHGGGRVRGLPRGRRRRARGAAARREEAAARAVGGRLTGEGG